MLDKNYLYNKKTIDRLCKNTKITDTQRKATERWLILLKEGKLKKERNAYIEFAKTLLNELLNYDIGIEHLQHESGNMEFPFLNADGTYAVYFEAKGTKTKDLFAKQYREKVGYETPVSQTWTKMSQFPIPYGICTNYKDFVLLDYSKGNSKYHLFDFYDIEDNDIKLKEFISIFSKKSIIDNKFLEKLYTESIEEERKFSNKFYKIFHETRLMLIKEFKECGISNENAIHYSQLFLNRMIFIFFAESTGKLHKRIFQKDILKILGTVLVFNEKTHHIYSIIMSIFERLNTGSKEPIEIFNFNGELFRERFPKDMNFNDLRTETHFQNILQHSKFKKRPDLNEATKRIIELHKNKLNPIVKNILIMGSFDFNTEVNVKILGHIFEQSISDIEELKRVDTGTPSKRKREGIYYTPEFITDYICRKTIISLLSEKGSTTIKELIIEYSDDLEDMNQKIEEMRILDPACGSGAFLLKAIEILIEIKKEIIEFRELKGEYLTEIDEVTKKRIKSKKSDTLKFKSLTKFNEIQEIKKIVQKNIFGVDLNEESVEITKLSVFFKICTENEKLLNLKDFIKCGNSLIDDVSIAGNKAFDWNKNFPQVLDAKGFNIIVGNPPYINALKMKEFFPKERKFLKENYSYLTEKWDIYIAFIERAIQLLKPSGYLCFIIPDAFLTEKYASKIQKAITTKYRTVRIDYFPNISIFKGIGVSNIILTIQNVPPQYPVLKVCFKELGNNIKTTKVNKAEDIFTDYDIERIELNDDKFHSLAEVCYISIGIVFNAKEPEYRGEFKKEHVISEKKTELHTRKLLEGTNVLNFEIPNHRYVEWNTDRVPNKVRRPTFPELHQKDKLVSNKLGKLKVAFDDLGFICDQTVRILIKWVQIKGVENRSINGSFKHIEDKKYIEDIAKNLEKFYNSNPEFKNVNETDNFVNFEKIFNTFIKNGKVIKGKPKLKKMLTNAINRKIRNTFEQISQSYDYFFILGLLNSEFIRSYFYNLRGKSSMDINPLNLRKIPIPILENREDQKGVIIISKKLSQLVKERRAYIIKTIKMIKTEFNIEISNKLKSWYDLKFEIFLKELERLIRKEKKKEGKKFTKLPLNQKSEWMDFLNDQKKLYLDIQEKIQKEENKLNILVPNLYNLSKEECSDN